METIEQVAREFCELAGVRRTEAVVASALQREAEDSTCVGRALAVPHARVEGLSCAGVYLVRLGAATKWPVDEVRMVAFLAVPEEAPEMYLKMLGQLMRWWMAACAEYGESIDLVPMAQLESKLASRFCS